MTELTDDTDLARIFTRVLDSKAVGVMCRLTVRNPFSFYEAKMPPGDYDVEYKDGDKLEIRRVR